MPVFVFGTALGALLAYFFDPQNGNRRRKLAVDRTAGFVRRRGRETARTGRAVAAEAYGVSQKVEHRKEEPKSFDDATLANNQLLDLQRNLGSFDGGPVQPSKNFVPDFLLTYLVHPGTALYIGYNNSFSNLQLNGTAPPILQSSPSNMTGRLFFVKLSYLFRY